MPPKVKFTKDDVIKAAFSIVENEGLKDLTARKIAKRLGSSTSPVYNHFESMDSLSLEVVKRIQKMMLDYTSREHTDRVFLNMGTGIALFACEHSGLYHALMLEEGSYRDIVNEFLDTLEIELSKDARFKTLSKKARHELLDKMWTYTHGLASLICVGMIKKCNKEFIIKNLSNVGADVIGSTMRKHHQEVSEKE